MTISRRRFFGTKYIRPPGTPRYLCWQVNYVMAEHVRDSDCIDFRNNISMLIHYYIKTFVLRLVDGRETPDTDHTRAPFRVNVYSGSNVMVHIIF